jgi:hypothetical protein
MDRGVLILAGIFGLGFALLVGAYLLTGAEACPQVAFRGLVPNPVNGPVRMLPEIVR